jgi:NitT/TauT family transport system ATP-binding protein
MITAQFSAAPTPFGEPRRPVSEPLVSLRGIDKVFEGESRPVTAVQEIDFSVASGEFISIVGPSGCGKSTVLMMIAGLLAPTRGTIRVAGAAVTDAITDVGIMFQRDLLMDWRTVIDNVLLQADVRGLDRATARKKAERLLKTAGLEGFEDAYPWELSGGMRQRAALCRALLPDVPLLLLDEPFGALDAMTRERMNLDLQRLWWSDRRTAILITHDISEAIFLSDRVLIMSPSPGRLIADIRIDLPHPRELAVRESSEFVEYKRQLRTIFEQMAIAC